MTADQLVEMDRLLEALRPGHALVITPDGMPYACAATRSRRWGAVAYAYNVVDIAVPTIAIVQARVVTAAVLWLVSWDGQWFTASLLSAERPTPFLHHVCRFLLAPSDGPSLTPTP